MIQKKLIAKIKMIQIKYMISYFKIKLNKIIGKIRQLN